MGARGLGVVGLAGVVWLSGCGYMGDPLPPALNIPVRVTDMRAVQQGARIRVDFTPVLTATDGLILPALAGTDLRIGPAGPPPFNTERWAAGATSITVDKPDPAGTRLDVSAKEWAGQEVVVAVRTISLQRKFSEWSNLATLRIVEPLQTPSRLQLEAIPQGIRVRWDAQSLPGLGWRIYRKSAEDENLAEAGKASRPEFADANLEYGKTYTYSVQAVQATGSLEAVSEFSEPVSLKLEDHFPPSAPNSLTAIQGIGSIELAWERSVDTDLQGYYLYRAEAEGEFTRVGALIAAPSVGDPGVSTGKRYRYRVTAVDMSGNEGPPSAIVEIAAP